MGVRSLLGHVTHVLNKLCSLQLVVPVHCVELENILEDRLNRPIIA